MELIRKSVEKLIMIFETECIITVCLKSIHIVYFLRTIKNHLTLGSKLLTHLA